MRTTLCALMILPVFTGCGPERKNEKTDWRTYVEVEQLGPHQFRVSASDAAGSFYDHDKAMLRSAELASEHGCSKFLLRSIDTTAYGTGLSRGPLADGEPPESTTTIDVECLPTDPLDSSAVMDCATIEVLLGGRY